MKTDFPLHLSYKDYDIKLDLGSIKINLLAVSYEPPNNTWSYDIHSHSSYEIHFVPNGKGTLEINDKKYDITPGTMYITGPGVMHAQKPDQDDPMNEFCINIEMTDLKKKDTKYDIYARDEIDLIYSTFQDTAFWIGQDKFSCYKMVDDILSEFQEKPIGFYTYVKNLTSQLIIQIVRTISDKKHADYYVPMKILDDSRRFIVDFYFSDCHLPLSAKELASKIGTSVRQLNRIIQQYYGLTFTQKLVYERLAFAKKLLSSTDDPIKEIATKSGYANYYNFSKTFKKEIGVTPTQYRKKKQKEGSITEQE